MSTQAIQKFPEHLSDVELLQVLKTENINGLHLQYLKSISGLTDEILADWLDINVKTFRSYKKKIAPEMRAGLKEHLVVLITLFHHGNEVFGDSDRFSSWLNQDNFFLDNTKPNYFLNTVTGVRFIDDRITAIEHGDNI